MAGEFKIKTGLQILNTQPVTGITNSSVFTNDSSSLATVNAIKNYVDGGLTSKTSFTYVDGSIATINAKFIPNASVGSASSNTVFFSNGFLEASVGGADLWTQSGNDIFYTAGNVGFGTPPGSRLTINGAIEHIGDPRVYSNVVSGVVAPWDGGSGTVIIRMPYSWSNTMMTIRIQGYDYSDIGAWEVLIGGYNFVGGGGQWININAVIRGSAPFSQVRLAHDGTRNVILLGNTGTMWRFGAITVSEFTASFDVLDGWGTGWSISRITTETGITHVTNVPITGGGMVYPGEGVPISTGATWGASIPLTNFVRNNQANTYGDFDQTFGSSRLAIRNPANTFSYNVSGGAIAANRALHLPVITSDDTIVTAAHTQTLINKSINISNNPITATSQAAGDIIRMSGGRFSRMARGTVPRQILRVNLTNDNIEWGNGRSFSTVPILPADNTFVSNITTGVLGTLAYAANRIDIAPFITAVNLPVLGALISISTAVAGNAMVVVYNTDVNGRPTTVAAQSANISTAAVATVEGALNFTFLEGVLYYVGVWTSAAPTLRVSAAGSCVPITWTNAATPVRQPILRTTSTFGATAPAWTYAAGQHTSADVPLVLFRIGAGVAPNNPTNVQAMNIGAGMIEVSWYASVGATRYEIRNNVNGGVYSSWTNVGNVTMTNLGAWLDGTNICVQVRACNLSGCSVGSTEVCTVIVAGDPF